MSEWADPATWARPRADVLDVFRFELRAAEDADWALLADDERARAERLIIESKRDQAVVSRAHLRRILGRALDRDPRELTFAYGEHDKPRLADDAIAFNLSHSHRAALVALTPARAPVGVDLEHMRRGREFEAIATRFFSGPEQRELLELPEPDRPGAFYRAWARKEAYLKAHGTGLSFSSARFTITYIDPAQPTRVVHTEMPGDEPERWHFTDLALGDYAGAVCWADVELEVRSWRWP